MKVNFKLSALEQDIDVKSDEQRQFEEMLVKAKAKGSFMVFTDFIDNPIDAMARAELYDKWLENAKSNLRFINAGVPQNIIEKAIVIGGGWMPIPEHEINRLRPDYHVFCVDRALRRLSTPPNFAVTVDADDLIAKYYDTNQQFKPVLPLYASSRINKHGLDPYWYIPSIDKLTDNIINRLTGLPVYQSYGTVTNTACVIAEAMGAKEIVLVNTTFGYPEGTPYDNMDWWNRFKDTGAKEETIRKAHKIIEHPVWKTKYISDPLFDIYRKGFYTWLEKTNVKVINTTGAGTLYHDKLTYANLRSIPNH